MIKPRYAEINLTTGTITDYPMSDLNYEQYLGGKGLAAKILYDELKPGIDALSPENIFIVNTGPMTGTGAPSSSRFNISSRNVLTGGIVSSNCGGNFGYKLRKAGFEGLIIRGQAAKPSYIEVLDEEICIKDASELMGLNTEETQHKFDRRFGCLVIGPAGENLVRYACVVSGERVAGRGGVGTVMGSKNLKAIVAYGTREIPIHNPAGLKDHTMKWVDILRSHPLTGRDLGLYGTAGFVPKCNASGIMPTHNFRDGSWDQADQISGQQMTETHLTRNSGCVSCPIRCERRVMVEGKEVKGPEFETVGLFGPNIENSDLGLINIWNYHADLLGMDTISLAGTMSFAMELQEHGIKDFGLSFGNTANILDAMYKIAHRDGELSELADGSKILSGKYGGQEFAIHSKGLELAAYEPRKSTAQGLGYATSNRGGCHLGGGYGALLEAIAFIPVDPVTTKGKPELTVMFQNACDVISTAGFCLFTAHIMVPGVAYRLKPSGRVVGMIGKTILNSRWALRKMWGLMPWIMPFNSMFPFPHAEAIQLATGLDMTLGKFLQIGDRVFNIERLFNYREGLDAKDDSLPKRLTNVPSDPDDPNTVVNLKEMLPIYYKTRGWTADGVPTKRKLRKLGITV